MKERGFATVTDQVTQLIREGMLRGRWRGTLPGRDRLAGELGVNHKTVEAAMRRLAAEGLLESQGGGRRRRIVLPKGKAKPREMRVRVLCYDSADMGQPCHLELLHELRREGFAADFALKSLRDLGMNVARVRGFVGADAG